jgi:SAM-dependent methyltransferase
VSRVAWHDTECGSYTADLPLWRELAAREAGPLLDVGAGTGRVARDLAAHGHAVTALDVDPELLAALDARAGGAVRCVVADAQDFDLGERFGLIVAPMQTVQLLPDRAAFLRCARAHLAPGGLLAAAVADELVPFEGPLPDPDVLGRYVSQPTAVRVAGGVARLERLRDDGETVTVDVVELHELGVAQLEREGAAAGLVPEPARRVDETPEHVGSTVVALRG